ncbi:hypothetical protein CLG96_01335 [Sphingomonas oleivorans]|uniref:Uncharacterized protein n=1 Tax=Sphingomonas oleivorans TaxID=1735121 RepID=A0A2T5G0Z4_9SPHN|nr:hypothetical protein [Sphingomonas oleivorans]PTQ12819.1 hypothetical protein CLG96_01335 [Sphingomonas oleivorans]
MVRILIGSILGGLAQFFVGFIFWGTPLARLAFASLGPAESTAVQLALAQNLTKSGTGTYAIPLTGTREGDILFAKGPVATVHFNVEGFPLADSGSLLAGLIFSIVTALLIGIALYGVASRVTALADRMRLVVLFAAASVLYFTLAQPVFNHFGWGYFVYLAISEFIGFAVAGLVIARWFLPRPAAMTVH